MQEYCTTEGLNHVYFKNDEYGYNSTEEIDKIEEDAYNFCFVQETIKCFHHFQCDIQNHTLALMDTRLSVKKREDRWMMGLAIAAASKEQAEKMRESWFIKYNETFKSPDELNETTFTNIKGRTKAPKSDAAANAKLNNIILFSGIILFFNVFFYLQ
uniref:Uncharacterized protein n=1 Tax=Panagrolaimus davidi TaxID=227884 RepID=A0A914QAC2_9BILA